MVSCLQRASFSESSPLTCHAIVLKVASPLVSVAEALVEVVVAMCTQATMRHHLLLLAALFAAGSASVSRGLKAVAACGAGGEALCVEA
jgi:hypothetical protein